MRAVVYQEPYKVTVKKMPDPTIEAPTGAVVRITATNICGSDTHVYERRTPARLLQVGARDVRLRRLWV